MQALYKKVSKLQISEKSKKELCLAIFVLFFCVLGALMWFIFGKNFLPGIVGLVCYVSYLGFFFGFIGGTLCLLHYDPS